MYKNLTKEESVHLADWPVSKILGDKDIKMLREMEIVRQIVEKAHAIRKEKAIPVRQPLSKLQISNYKLQIKGLEKLLMEELNVKEVASKRGRMS